MRRAGGGVALALPVRSAMKLPAVTIPLFADEAFINGVLDDTYWSLADYQGTVRDIADYDASTDTTSIVNHLTFNSFGNLLSQTDNNYEPRAKYTGRYTDPDTGLQWNNGRWYDPKLRRWLSEDHIWDGYNKYAYVGNNPINSIDPSGLAGFNPGTQLVFPDDPDQRIRPWKPQQTQTSGYYQITAGGYYHVPPGNGGHGGTSLAPTSRPAKAPTPDPTSRTAERTAARAAPPARVIPPRL